MAAHDCEKWLCEKLQDLNIDHEVFGSYIQGIMDSEDTDEEKREALEGILSEVSEENLLRLCDEIFGKWSAVARTHNGHNLTVDIDAKIASIMEEQTKAVTTGKPRTAEEKEYRDAILAQYSQVSDGEDNMNDDPGGMEGATSRRTVPQEQNLLPNTNATMVATTEKEKREKSKQDHEKKKAQDKLNKEKQKQAQQERKEKERKRTQKSEKRR